ncbi:MAG: hypothetical protein F2693_14110 [Actinobacteria bacterium]|nr:hypothetical protein [Actinomycetota bacterium]
MRDSSPPSYAVGGVSGGGVRRWAGLAARRRRASHLDHRASRALTPAG